MNMGILSVESLWVWQPPVKKLQRVEVPRANPEGRKRIGP